MAFKKDDIIIIEPKEIFVGNKDAAVTLVEFGEYESEECAKANEIVKQLMEEYGEKMRFQFRHFPLTLIHQRSLKASESAVAAGQEGKFWEMHHMIFENQRRIFKNALLEYATSINLNLNQFESDLDNPALIEKVESDFESGLRSGVNATPTFFVNGENIPKTGKEMILKSS